MALNDVNLASKINRDSLYTPVTTSNIDATHTVEINNLPANTSSTSTFLVNDRNSKLLINTSLINNDTVDIENDFKCSDNISIDNSSSDNESQNDSLLLNLRKWAAVDHCSIPHNAITDLLKILHSLHPELPLDCRTLLQTPIKCVTKMLTNGVYCHFLLKNSLTNFLLHSGINVKDRVIEIMFNIDGLPLFKSSNIQLWPILGLIKQNFNQNKPFVVGVFCGNAKPKPLDVYLKDFIDELNELIETGFEYNSKIYKIVISCFVCDAPARAYLKCIKSHCGYSSCERCVQTGEYINGRVVLRSLKSPKRTDESFSLQTDDDHHIGISPLIMLPIGLVSKFPIDYMHNICLGVMRKLLHTWLHGNLKVRLCSRLVNLLSKKLIELKAFIPIEINRKPTSLDELSRWKASEFRTFLLYVGPVTLYNLLDIAVYEHFLLLHVSISILISTSHIDMFGYEFSSQILNIFVKHCEVLYGPEFMIYNVHLLSHIVDDVINYGSLDNFSAFPFENFLGQIKRLVKSPNNPLPQVYRRLKEYSMMYNSINKFTNNYRIRYQLEHFNGPLLHTTDNCSYKQYKKIHANNVCYAINLHSNADSYCLIDDIVVQIYNILVSDKQETMIIGKHFKSYESAYTYPLDSKSLFIYKLKDLSTRFRMFSFENVRAKCMVLPFEVSADKTVYVSFPLIHSL